LRYQDNVLKACAAPGVIDAKTIESLGQIIQSHLNNPAQLAEWFGKYMTEPKYDPDTGQASQPNRDELAEAQTELSGHDGPLFQAPDARFACHETTLFANGKSYPCGPELALELANNRCISNWRSHLTNPDYRNLLAELVASAALWLEDPLEANSDELEEDED